VEPNPGRWVVRAIVVGGEAAGLALLVAAALADDPPLWWWIVGAVLAAAFGWLSVVTIRLARLSPEERQRRVDALAARQQRLQEPMFRSTHAHKATKHKKQVLRDGLDGTAVVTFLADGQRGNEYHQLVYLELEVTLPGSAPYEVKTGEYLTAASSGSVSPGRELVVRVDPADPQRVAVDWERSLRLR
jgi:hypothetical protein